MKKIIYLISIIWFNKTFSQTFTNNINPTGILSAGGTGGTILNVADYNNDGFEDLLYYTSTGVKLMKNTNGVFSDITVASGLTSVTFGWPKLYLSKDFDNNGYIDLITVDASNNLNIFLNNGGVFVNSNAALNITNPYFVGNLSWGDNSSSPVMILDHNKDGKLDLMISRIVGGQSFISVLINNLSPCGTGSFSPIQNILGPFPNANYFVPIDTDNDQDFDLLVCEQASSTYNLQTMRLYINNNNTYTLAAIPGFNPTSIFGWVNTWDYNNDGYQDLLAGCTDVVSNGSHVNRIYRNNGNNTFTDMSATIALKTGNYYYMRSTAIDYDNDMDLDLYWFVNGYGATGNQFYKNNAGVFSNQSAAVGLNQINTVGPPGQTTGCPQTWLDINNDGILEVFCETNTTPRLLFSSNSNKYIKIKLNGCESAKTPVGANVFVYKNGLIQSQVNSSGTIMRGGNFHTGSSQIFHFGMGNNLNADSIKVFWPSGIKTVLYNVTTNQILTINENSNCSLYATPTLTATSTTSIICSGFTNTLSVIGAQTYTWQPGNLSGASVTVSPTSNTTYTVTGTNTNGCKNTAIKTITVNSLPISSIALTGNDSICNGTSTTLLGSGGVSYSWSNGVNTATNTVNATGIYTVVVTDANGCNDTSQIKITVAPPIQINYNVTSPLCFGQNGSITYTTSGGIAPLNTQWLGSINTTNLAAGTYSSLTTDALGCQLNSTVEVIQPSQLQISTSASNILCNGGQSGNATAIVNGGVSPYTYLWSNGTNTSSISTLSSGVYSVQVLDANNCSTNTVVTITEPTALSASVNVTAATCVGAQDGNAQLNVNGGITPYIYAWNNGSTSAINNNLSAGNYSVIVSDANACTYTLSIIINDGALPCFTVPGGFSPNGDGINDTWEIPGIDKYPNAVVTILNRWGQEIFNVTNYTTPWNGSYKGSILPTADYYYIIKLDSNSKPLTGTVTIKR